MHSMLQLSSHETPDYGEGIAGTGHAMSCRNGSAVIGSCRTLVQGESLSQLTDRKSTVDFEISPSGAGP